MNMTELNIEFPKNNSEYLKKVLSMLNKDKDIRKPTCFDKRKTGMLWSNKNHFLIVYLFANPEINFWSITLKAGIKEGKGEWKTKTTFYGIDQLAINDILNFYRKYLS